jgi:hypothetical protein
LDKILLNCTPETQKEFNFRGIRKLREFSKDNEMTEKTMAVCCSLCFYNPSVDLFDSFVKVQLKKKLPDAKGKPKSKPSPQMGNFQHHLRTCDQAHQDFLEETKLKSASTSSNVSVGTTGLSSYSAVASHAYTEWAQLPKAQIIARIHHLIYQLVNDSNIPVHIFRNPALWDMVEFIIRNSQPVTMACFKYISI